MLNRRGFFAEIKDKIFEEIKKATFFNVVHADEGSQKEPEVQEPTPANNPSQPTAPQMNFEEMIARVRREEKDKLYGEITSLKKDVEELRKSNNSYILQLAERGKKIEELESKQENSETASLRNEVERLKGELEDAKNKAPNEEEIRAKIEKEYEVKLYAKEKISEHKGDILSIFVDEITGDTKESVDASIQRAIEKSVSVKKDLGLLDENGNPVKKRRETGKPSAPPVVNPSTLEAETFDAEKIRNMDPRSPEYQEFRKKMGLK